MATAWASGPAVQLAGGRHWRWAQSQPQLRGRSSMPGRTSPTAVGTGSSAEAARRAAAAGTRVSKGRATGTESLEHTVVVVGGGAAGFFAAIQCAEHARRSRAQARVIVLEKSSTPLGKVLISGGGRCNVTHNEPDVEQLCEAYPRGQRELRGPFSRFGVSESIAWFESHGVRLKTERDGRMFPTTDDAETVASALRAAASHAGVEVIVKTKVVGVRRQSAMDDGDNGDGDGDVGERGFVVECASGRVLEAEAVLLAPGSAREAQKWAEEMGHRTEKQVASLFTMKVADERLSGLAGVAVPYAKVSLAFGSGRKRGGGGGGHGGDKGLTQQGAVLITHWGLSGPAILRLSSFGARKLSDAGYTARLHVDWMPCRESSASVEMLEQVKRGAGSKKVHGYCPLPGCMGGSGKGLGLGVCEREGGGSERFPRRLWARLAERAGIDSERRWSEVSKKDVRMLVEEMHRGEFAVRGKGAFKEEFVTAGGVGLSGIDLGRMESKSVKGLFFAGEVVDVDGVTGGFNFQSAWTTGYLAGCAVAARIAPD